MTCSANCANRASTSSRRLRYTSAPRTASAARRNTSKWLPVHLHVLGSSTSLSVRPKLGGAA